MIFIILIIFQLYHQTNVYQHYLTKNHTFYLVFLFTIKYSKNIWDSKDNPALYLNSNEFNISSESIGRYFYEIRSGISFGSVIINGERYIINSNGIEKSFDVKYTYDKEGEYVIKLDDIMYSKETLATFLTSKGIIQNSDEIAALTIM